MQAVTVQVQNRIMGGNTKLPALESIGVRLENTRISVEGLIRRTVEEQVWDLLNKRRMEAADARRMLERHYYTETEIARMAGDGAVRTPPRGGTRVPAIDPDEEVRRAVDAFRQGAYLVLVDGRQMASLEDEVTLAKGSKVSFLRLTPLVGG